MGTDPELIGGQAATIARPQRVQRRRAKGWTMPEGAVYVGRPSRWGNPFGAFSFLDVPTSVSLYADVARGIWSPTLLNEAGLTDAEFTGVYNAAEAWKRRIGGHPAEVARCELAGRDLACWCPLGQPCHADVLLVLANPTQGETDV